MKPETKRTVAGIEFDRMRRYGVGGIVGQEALTCWHLAKARAEWFARDDVQITHEPEYENYLDVYGKDSPKDQTYCCVVVRIAGEVKASLGFVEDNDDRYLRLVENEMLAEAFAQERES